MQEVPDKQTAKPLVAVLDDDASFLRSMNRMLLIEGYRVSLFSSPADFLRSLTLTMPLCLVIDLHMPEMTGLEVQDRLLAEGVCLPAILVTAYETQQTRDQALRRGFLGVLIKPFDGELLLRTIEAVNTGQPSHLN